MEKIVIKATKEGSGFNNSDVAYSAIGISSVEEANQQIREMYEEDDALVYFTCANVAAARIRDKRHLYETFSRDELDALLFYCMDAYQKIKYSKPYDGTLPFEAYVTKFILTTGRQAYARSKETDYDHLVSTARNKNGDVTYYGTNGKMVLFTSVDDMDDNMYVNTQRDIPDEAGGFEEAIIDKVDAECRHLSKKLIDKLENAHPLLKIVFRYWAMDCHDGFVPFYKYLSDERVLSHATSDERCAKYVIENPDGSKHINPSTASKMLYKFQNVITKDDVREIVRFGTDVEDNPYLEIMFN